MTILTAVPEDPTGYGRIVRDAPDRAEVDAIVEQKALKPEQRVDSTKSTPASTRSRSRRCCKHLDKTHQQQCAWRVLPHRHGRASARGRREGGGDRRLPRRPKCWAPTPLPNWSRSTRACARRPPHRLMAAGVTIFRPETCVIDAEVEIEPDTIIEPFVQLLGKTRIGGDCRIRSYSVIENCTLGNDVLMRQGCVLAESTVADGARIGPFAHLRPGSEIGEDAHVGNFVETKKAKLGKGAKANHLTYLGDAEVGAGTNIGAGRDHLQLRRRTQAHHPHRPGRVCRQRLDAGCADRDRRWRLYRRRLLHHPECPFGRTRGGTVPAGDQGRLGGGPSGAREGNRNRSCNVLRTSLTGPESRRLDIFLYR